MVLSRLLLQVATASGAEGVQEEAYALAFATNWHACVLLAAPDTAAAVAEGVPTTRGAAAAAPGGVSEALALCAGGGDFGGWCGLPEHDLEAWPGSTARRRCWRRSC